MKSIQNGREVQGAPVFPCSIGLPRDVATASIRERLVICGCLSYGILPPREERIVELRGAEQGQFPQGFL